MKFGYQLDFRNPPDSGLSFERLYQQLLDQAAFAEQIGMDSVWLTEHHFTDDGYLPSLLPAAAAIAARTQRIKIGTYVLLVPFFHPLKLAEDVAVVDVISGGRLRLGLGQGYRAEEFAGFGVPRSQRLGRTLETIEILKRAWSGERFSHSGKYFSFENVRVLPKPSSKPYPELLWGVGAPAAIRRGAEMDLSFACVAGRREIGIYLDALKALGKDPGKFSIVNSRVVYIADSPEQGWREIGDALMYQAALYGQWLSAAAKGDMSKVLIRPDPERLKRTSILGPASYVTERITEILEQTPMTEMIVVMQLPGVDPIKARRSLEKFGTHVLPGLKQLPVLESL